MAKYESEKNNLYKFMIENPEMKKKDIAEKFIGISASKTTVYLWIEQVKENGTLKRKIAPGRPAKISTKGKTR